MKSRIDAQWDPNLQRFIVADPSQAEDDDSTWMSMEVDIGPSQAPPRQVQVIVGGIDFLHGLLRRMYGRLYGRMLRPEMERINEALHKEGMEMLIVRNREEGE